MPRPKMIVDDSSFTVHMERGMEEWLSAFAKKTNRSRQEVIRTLVNQLQHEENKKNDKAL